MPVLHAHLLSKRYGSVQALKEVSFDVPPGSVFGILGPNGSGKTTLLGILTDILRADKGFFLFFDAPPDAAQRRRIGTLLETPNFYHYLSAEENLHITARIKRKGIDQIPAVLEQVNLSARKDSPFSTYSLGMKQRLAIASALLGDPDVLILDEPTNGLDPVGIAEIRELIRQLAQRGKTIIMASHMLDEVEKVCTHVAILKKGQLITSGPVDEILAQEDRVEAAAADTEALFALLSQMPGHTGVHRKGDAIHIGFPPGTAGPDTVNRFCFENGLTLTRLQPVKKSLETKFLELTHQ